MALGTIGLSLLGLTMFGAASASEPAATACPDCAPAVVAYATVKPRPSPTEPLLVLVDTEPTATPTLTATLASTATDLIQATPTLTVAATASPRPTVDVLMPPVATSASYTSTAQVAPPPSVAEASPTPEAPAATPGCPLASSAQFDLIPIEGQPVRDYPDAVHGDLNLALRGYIPAAAPLELVTYNGSTDDSAPRLHGLFEPNRPAQLIAVYRVNDWQWDPAQCGGHPRGCPAPPADTYWPVTMIGLAAAPGEAVYIPERGPQIYPGGFIAMVLYAEETRLTLGYTRRDGVNSGYTVHLENVCVDPNLVALYRAQMDAEGWHATGQLPALRNNQPLGVALDPGLGVAIRDSGAFMDPRSQKDWWR